MELKKKCVLEKNQHHLFNFNVSNGSWIPNSNSTEVLEKLSQKQETEKGGWIQNSKWPIISNSCNNNASNDDNWSQNQWMESKSGAIIKHSNNDINDDYLSDKIGLLLCYSHIELRLRLRLSWCWYWDWFAVGVDVRLRWCWVKI